MLPKYLLKTKLLPPRLGKRVMPRPRLLDRLRGYTDHAATIVSASAGCGKTTLVAEHVHSSGLPFVWYQIDGADVDLAVFFAYLTHGLRRLAPEFGDSTLSFIRAFEDVSSKADQLVDVFLTEVTERVEDKVILVLDDFHQVDSSAAVSASLDRLVQYLPDVLHIVIISRTLPNLSVTRLRSKGLLGLVDRRDLLFTESEVGELFEKVFMRALPAKVIGEFYTKTEGWITGLQLIEQAIEGSGFSNGPGPGCDLTTALQRSELDIFDYFADEVLKAETQERRRLLAHLSLLEEIEPAVCESVFGEGGCGEQLRDMARRNTFVSLVHTPGNEEQYRLHPLFRSFLKRRLTSEAGSERIRELHRRLGDYFEGIASWEVAVHHYIEAAAEDDLARVLAERGAELMKASRLELIKRAFEGLSEGAASSRPRAVLARADVALIEGDQALARRLFDQAARIAANASDIAVEAEALRGQAYIARYEGNCEKATELASAAIDLAPESHSLRARCYNVIGLCRFFASQDTERAIESWSLALEEARKSADERLVRIVLHNLGLPYSVEGDFNQALRWINELIRRDPVSGGEGAKPAPFPQEAVAHLNVARIAIGQGRFDEAELHLGEAMDRSRTFHLVGYEAQTLEAFGNLYRERGEFQKALDFYEEAARAYGHAGQTDRELMDERALLFLRMGDLKRARRDAEEYYRVWSSQSPTHRAHALITLGCVQMVSGEIEAAEAALREAVDVSRKNRLNYNAARALTSLARLLWNSGRSEEAIDTLEGAVELSQRYDYSYWLTSEAELSPELFREASNRAGSPWSYLIGLDALSTTVVRADPVRPVQTGIAIEGASFDLTIDLLGSIRVRRGAEEAPSPEAWPLAKSLHIFCYLASRRSHRATKDMLVELFWPDADSENVARNFHPTISHLRKALNYGQVVRKDFLVYREGAYFLNPQYRYRIDAEEFETLVVSSREARSAGQLKQAAEMAAQAIHLYRGDFLEELYYDWIGKLQSYYRDLSLEALNELAAHHLRSGEHEAAISYAQMILQRDAYREDVHCLVMEANVRAGNRAAAIEQFDRLHKLLRDELGVDPLPATVARYKELIT